MTSYVQTFQEKFICEETSMQEKVDPEADTKS